MIHSARPTVSPVANIVFAWHLFCFVKFIRTDGRHVQKQWSLPAVTVGRPRGSIFSLFFPAAETQDSANLCSILLTAFSFLLVLVTLPFSLCVSVKVSCVIEEKEYAYHDPIIGLAKKMQIIGSSKVYLFIYTC